MTITTKTFYVDSREVVHATRTLAERAEVRYALEDRIEKKAIYGELGADMVLEFIDENSDVILTYLGHGEHCQ